MSADLLIIIPTRGRPQAVADLMTSWRATTNGDAVPLFVTDDDDPKLPEYERVLGKQDTAMHLTLPRLRLAGTLNKVASMYWDDFPMLGFWGDDNRPRTTGWDTHFARIMRQWKTAVCYGNDLYQMDRLPTAVAMTSNIPKTLGYMAIPGPVHLCLDLAWKDWGDGIGRLRYFPTIIIEHLHPSAGKGRWDATYEDCNSMERNAHDHPAYEKYREETLPHDLAKLRRLL